MATIANTIAPSAASLKVVGLIASLVPYHHARWQAFAELSGAECSLVELTDRDEFAVLEVRRQDPALYERISLFEARDASSLCSAEIRRALHAALHSLHPDVVCINGYASSMSFAALQWCRVNDRPAVVCSESNAGDHPRNRLKEFGKRQVVRCFSAGLAGGRPQAAYLVELGVPKEKIFTGYDVVDNSHFAAGAKTARRNDKALRQQLDLPANYFLACARFTEKKNYPLLIDAYAHYRSAQNKDTSDDKSSWSLVLVGDGPLRTDMEAKAAALGLGRQIQFRGAIPYAELPTYYGLAGAFLHASKIEQWGLVVNEAMASGLPVIVSDRCGCVADLVIDGETGLRFDPFDHAALSRCMLDITQNVERRTAMGRASQERIQRWGPERFAHGLQEAVMSARANGPVNKGALSGLILHLLGRCSK